MAQGQELSAVDRAATLERLAEGTRLRPSRRARLWRLARRKLLGTISAFIILLLAVLAVFGPYIAPYGAYEKNMLDRLQGPSTTHFFGTDEVGRDVFSRVIAGARISLRIGFLAVALGTVIGSTIGLISGYFEGRLDMVLQRIADGLMAFPGLVFLIAIVAFLGQGMDKAIIGISILLWPGANRIVRGTVLSVKRNTFVEAARSIGAGDSWIIYRHILPNVAAPIIIIASTAVGAAILLEASLGFLGLGNPYPSPGWGTMLSGPGRSQMERAPWLALAPGLAISIAVLSFNLLGDALRDIWDPRLRGTS
ncbi:MAG: ABC transporter permease [Chloroflexi bacterium]|nr:ABC transporter permease [Chloroflexota bacterium]